MISGRRVEPRGADGDRRRGVLDLLRTDGGARDAGWVAAQVGLAVSTARFHLDNLVAEGLVRVAREHQHRPGRPRLTYRALPPEGVDGESSYRHLAGLLAEVLAGVDPRLSLVAGRRWADDLLLRTSVLGPIDTVVPEQVHHEFVRRVVDLLDEGGFAPRLVASGRLELHRCPFLGLAERCADVVCGVHLGLLRGLADGLGLDAQPTLIPVTDGSGPCLVDVPLPRSAPSDLPIP